MMTPDSGNGLKYVLTLEPSWWEFDIYGVITISILGPPEDHWFCGYNGRELIFLPGGQASLDFQPLTEGSGWEWG